MAKTITYELPSGKTVEFEVSDSGPRTRDFAAGSATDKGGPLDEAMEKLTETLAVFTKGLDAIEKIGPDKLSLEISAELGPGGIVKFFLGEAKGGLKITMSWDKVKN